MIERDARASLTGVWDGSYSYPAHLAPVEFTATLLEIGAYLSGTTHESPSDGPEAGRTRTANVEGERSGGQVRFTKVYEDAGAKRPILYVGHLAPEGDNIEGQWSIPGNWSGRFVMRRSGSDRAGARQAQAAVARLG